jgi:uroporphyrinogen decarboxylase
MQDWKHKSCIPHFIDFTLKDRSTLDMFLERLQPDPRRLPADADEHLDRVEKGDIPVSLFCGSMIGSIRNWMGVENLAIACFEDPEMIGELVDAMSDVVCSIWDPVLQRHQFDLAQFWEDICGKNGPLVTPKVFQEQVVPGYKKITSMLHDHGVNLISVDCDGWIDPLVPYWLEAGINIMFPFEIGTWNADPMEYRRKYGKELRIFGGFNKLVLEKGRAAIDEELERRIPLAREGGFIIFPDHLITPGTSVEDYQYYLDKIRALRF